MGEGGAVSQGAAVSNKSVSMGFSSSRYEHSTHPIALVSGFGCRTNKHFDIIHQ